MSSITEDTKDANVMLGKGYRDTDTEKATVIAMAKPVNMHTYAGIYFLINDGEIVYVGQSANVMSRIAAHVSQNSKSFSHFYSYEAKKDDLDELEAIEIIKHNPRYNDKLPNNSLYKEIGYFKKVTGMTIPELRRIFRGKVATVYIMSRTYYSVSDARKVLL